LKILFIKQKLVIMSQELNITGAVKWSTESVFEVKQCALGKVSVVSEVRNIKSIAGGMCVNITHELLTDPDGNLTIVGPVDVRLLEPVGKKLKRTYKASILKGKVIVS
jgi:hypothetical protein